MLRFRLFRKWPWQYALCIVVVLAVFAWLFLRAGGSAAAPVEIVNDRPIRAVHEMLAADVTGAASTVGGANAVGGTNRGFQQPAFADDAGDAAQARVEIPFDYYDFGRIGADEVVRRDFLVINRGSAPLAILQAYTTCGCTTAELSASLIPPGKASRVRVVFDAGFHPVSGLTVRRGVVLETNDPDHPEVEIWVQASIGR